MRRARGYCANPSCGCGPVSVFAGECRTCYQYRYRNHVERPPRLVIRSASRVSARMYAQSLRRQA